MSLELCIQQAVDDGHADRARAQYAQQMWRELSDRYANQHPRHIAEGMAADDVRNALRKEFGIKRHKYLAKMGFMRQAQGAVERAQHLDRLPANTLWSRVDSPDNSITDAESLRRALVERMNWRMRNVLEDHHRPLFAKHRNEEGLQDMIRAIRGENVDDPRARALAEEMSEVFEELRTMFNMNGGYIGKLDGWLPQNHNSMAIRRAGFNEWYRYVGGRLDWDRIPDRMTDRPMSETFANMSPRDAEASRQRFLREIYDTITSDGATQLEPTYGLPPGEALHRRRDHERILHFKSADDWMDYNRDFGSGDIFGALMSHVHTMARDISLMRALGPDPKSGLQYYSDLAVARAGDADGGRLQAKIRADQEEAERMLSIFTGAKQPKSELQHKIATGFSTVRTLQTAAHLDRAVLANLSDMNTIRVAARTIGLNQANVFSEVARGLSGMSRQEQLQMGHIAATMADPGTVQARFLSEYPPLEIANRISNAVFRMQGLSHLTDQTRMVFRMEQEGQLGRNAARPLSDVEPILRERLERYGITAEDWDALRDQRFLHRPGLNLDDPQPDGSMVRNTVSPEEGPVFANLNTWLYKTDLPREQAERIYDKVARMMEREVEMAVPTFDLRMRARWEGDHTPGTPQYEVAKTMTAYKSFLMTFTMNQYSRAIARKAIENPWAYAAQIVGGATIMGALVVQLGEILRGRDTRPMDNIEFWTAAAARGGGLGPLADIAIASETQWGGGIGAWAAGPMPGLAEDVYRVTLGQATRLARGEDTNIGREAAHFMRRHTPGWDLPWLGPVMDRMVAEQMMMFFDPEAVKALERGSQRWEDNYGNKEWWPRGSAEPARTPQINVMSP